MGGIRERAKSDFAYHAARSDADIEAHQVVRDLLLDVATSIIDLTPDGREQSLALTKLEEAMFWANAAIARPRPVA